MENLINHLRIYALISMIEALIGILICIGLWYVIIISGYKIIELSFGWGFVGYVILFVFSLGLLNAMISDDHKTMMRKTRENNFKIRIKNTKENYGYK